MIRFNLKGLDIKIKGGLQNKLQVHQTHNVSHRDMLISQHMILVKNHSKKLNRKTNTFAGIW